MCKVVKTPVSTCSNLFAGNNYDECHWLYACLCYMQIDMCQFDIFRWPVISELGEKQSWESETGLQFKIWPFFISDASHKQASYTVLPGKY